MLLTCSRMVRDQIPSALFIEDDSDWDVTLKAQLFEFAHGTRYLQETDDISRSRELPVKTYSPYGDDWDLLWIGHCGIENHKDRDQKYWVIQDDPTAIPKHLRKWHNRQPNFTPVALNGTNSRIVFTPRNGLCTSSYALSLRGARKLLYHQSILGKALASDLALRTLCNHNWMNFTCYAPYPGLVGAHRAAGDTSRDSDRENKKESDGTNVKGLVREVAETFDIAFPTLLNLKPLMSGNKTVLSQWPNDTLLSEIDIAHESPRGHGVFVTKEEYL
jgi:hypothetical protein